MCGSCCKGWSVYADENALQKMEKEPDYIKNIEQLSTGKIRFNSGVCSFLFSNEDGMELCKIHANLGEDALPSTCDLYPRRVFFGERTEGFELSLSLSCPTVLQLLNRDEKIDFLNVSDKNYIKQGTPFTNLGDGILTTSKGKLSYFFVEPGLINIVQNRDDSIVERLSILKKTIEKYSDVLVESIDSKLFINELLSDYNFMGLILFYSKQIGKDFSQETLKDSLMNMLDNDEITSNNLLEFNGERVCNIIEHYMTSYIFSKEFYLLSFSTAYLKLEILIKLISLLHKSSLDISVLDSIFIVERSFAHNKNFTKYVEQSALV